ncbi:glycoside hydrolase family 9 protein, partial [Candidatus Margulisiibacteriota bacterium]
PSKNPHYRPSMSSQHPLPKGLLIGGPNSVEIGGDVPLAAVWEKPPYLRYVDDKWSWATNEVTIYWNAALVNVLSILAAK